MDRMTYYNYNDCRPEGAQTLLADEFREYLYGMPEYEDMTDEQTTRVVERAAFYYGGGLRTVKGAVERAIQDVRWWGL